MGFLFANRCSLCGAKLRSILLFAETENSAGEKLGTVGAIPYCPRECKKEFCSGVIITRRRDIARKIFERSDTIWNRCIRNPVRNFLTYGDFNLPVTVSRKTKFAYHCMEIDEVH